MRRYVLFVFLTTLTLLSAFPTAAQTSLDTVSHPVFRVDSTDALRTELPRGISLGFDRVLSLYIWRSTVDYGTLDPSHPDRASFQVHLDGSSRLSQDNGSQTTEATGLVMGAQPLLATGALTPFFMFYGTSYVTSLSGARASDVFQFNRQVDGFGLLGLRCHIPATDIDLSGGMGIARQSQPFTSAYGTIIRGDLIAPGEVLGENSSDSSAITIDERFFRERQQRYSSDHLLTHAASAFGSQLSDGRNDAILGLGLLRRDFFFPLDSLSQPAKQERTEMSLSLIDSVTYPIVPNRMMGTVDLEFEPKSVSRTSDVASSLFTNSSFSALSSLLVPNDVSSLRLAALARIVATSFGASGLSIQGQMRYEERSEDVSLRSTEIAGIDPASIRKIAATLNQASYASRTTQATLTTNYAPSATDTMQLDASSRLLSYDTPSDDNHDDHDELVSGLRFQYGRMFSPELSWSMAISASRAHLVYLKSDRSAQNSVTRSIDLSTRTTLYSSHYFGSLRAEVFANYTVLDFLDALPILQTVGSYVLRGLEIHDSSLVPLDIRPFDAAGPITLQGNGDLRISERGSYQQSAFSERRDTRVAEVSSQMLVGMQSIEGVARWQVLLGARGFWLSRFGRADPSNLTLVGFSELDKQTRIGPIAIVNLTRSNGYGPQLSGSIWYSVIKSISFESTDNSSVPQLESHLQVEWRF